MVERPGPDLNKQEDVQSGTNTEQPYPVYRNASSNNGIDTSKDPTLYTKEELKACIDKLKQQRDEQREQIKAHDAKYNQYMDTIKEATKFREDASNKEFDIRMVTIRLREEITELRQKLKEALTEVDGLKVVIVMEKKVKDELRRKVKGLRIKYEKLTKKNDISGTDKLLMNAYNDSKRRHEAAREQSERLNQQVCLYETEITRLRECLKDAHAHVASHSEVSHTHLAGSKHNDEISGALNITKCATLPPIARNVDNLNFNNRLCGTVPCSANASNQGLPNIVNSSRINRIHCVVPGGFSPRENGLHLNDTVPVSSKPMTNGNAVLPPICNSVSHVNRVPHPPTKPMVGNVSNKLPQLSGSYRNANDSVNHVPHPPSKRANGATKVGPQTRRIKGIK